jgi:hypothetical protein
LLCKTWSGKTCTECADRTYFNADGVCASVSAQCNTFDKATGKCLSCFAGYDVVDGVCVYSPANTAAPADLGCGNWDWKNQVCVSCSKRWAFNDNKVCVPVADQCASHDEKGNCASCYKGYDLKDGKCLFSDSNNAHPADSGCGTWDWDNQVCLSCSNGWVFNSNKVCTPVSDQCASHDSNGACLTCFKGYDLKEGACVFSASNNAHPSDSGCGTWDWDNQKCLSCSKGWFANSNGVCVPVSDQCASSNSAGNCLTCFKGYDLKDGACLFSEFNNAHPSDSGCATWDWDNQVCLSCSKNWVFNDKKVCTPVSDLCASHDEKGNCASCFKGYDLKEGACVFSPHNNAHPADSGCGTWDWDNQVCLACSKGFVFNADKVCVPVSDQCATSDSTGACLSCFKGYDLKDGKCIFSDSNNAHPSDSGCGTWDWDNQKCLSCSFGFVFNADKVCVPVSDQCASHDDKGNCLTCFKGYDVKNGVCIFSASNNAHPSDSGCGTWDWDNQVCLSCSKGFVFNADKVCTPVSDQCASHDEKGNCVTCFKGYDLKDGKCIFADSNNAHPSDSGCATWDWDNQVCLACSKKWVFNEKKVCTPVSDQCASHDEKGNCVSCFKGYELKDGACVFAASNNAKPADSGCGTWDWDNQVCLACSKNWVFNSNKVCVPVSDQCATSDSNGACLTCFKGYDLKDGACVFSASNNAHPADSGCGTWDWDNQVCLACSKHWVFNSNKVCVPVSDQCASHDEKGNCVTCFKGYDLKEGACVFAASNNAHPADSGCGTWDWDNQKCLSCSKGFVFNADKVCVPVSDQCASNDEKGNCLTCFKGYDLKDGACVFSSFNNAHPADSGCGTWDWNGQKCLACSKGWFFNTNQVCTPISDQCASSNEKGNCLTCFSGYDLKDGACLFSEFNNAHPADIGCSSWDWKNQVCLACSKRWFFNSHKTCVPVDDNCNTHDENGACTSCYQGYAVNSGVCISVNPLCKTLNADGTCASCYPQNVLHKGSCVPINKLANILLYYAACCPEKLAALQASQKSN